MNPQVFHGLTTRVATKVAPIECLCGLTLYLWGITLGQRGNLLFWEQEVECSNHSAPTIFPIFVCRVFFHGVLILPILPISVAVKMVFNSGQLFAFLPAPYPTLPLPLCDLIPPGSGHPFQRPRPWPQCLPCILKRHWARWIWICLCS